MRTVVDAFCSDVFPETVTCVAVVVASVVVPCTFAIPLAVKFVDEALPRDVCPVTDKVPFEVSDEVAVIAPPVKVLIKAERKAPAVEKKVDDVALPRDADEL